MGYAMVGNLAVVIVQGGNDGGCQVAHTRPADVAPNLRPFDQLRRQVLVLLWQLQQDGIEQADFHSRRAMQMNWAFGWWSLMWMT